MIVGERMKCITCYQNNPPDILKEDPFISSLGESSHKKNKIRPISHEKMTHLVKSSVTMNYKN